MTPANRFGRVPETRLEMQIFDGLTPDTDKKFYRSESNQYDPDEVEFMLAIERYNRE
jgi:hypothetical protein